MLRESDYLAPIGKAADVGALLSQFLVVRLTRNRHARGGTGEKMHPTIENIFGITDTWVDGAERPRLISDQIVRIPFWVRRCTGYRLQVSIVMPTDALWAWINTIETQRIVLAHSNTERVQTH